MFGTGFRSPICHYLKKKKWIDRLLHMDIEELELGCLIE